MSQPLQASDSYRFVRDDEVKIAMVSTKKWPFSSMTEGQILEISDKAMLASAVNAYHYVARKRGWKFKRRTSVDGVIYIKRIS